MPYVGEWDSDFRQYDLGDEVSWQGQKYKIIQPHRSQTDWPPNATPALWQDVGRSDAQPWQQQPQQPPAQPWQQQSQPQQPPQQSFQQPAPDAGTAGYPVPDGDHKIQPEEHHKGWDDLSDERKKQLEIGGGLAAGLGLLGAGFALYKHHANGEEEKKRAAFEAKKWHEDALNRRGQFLQGRVNAPVNWILADGKQMPSDAYVAGNDQGHPIFICRAPVDKGLQIGKASDWFKTGAVVGFGGDEHNVEAFEVLTADPRAIRWVEVTDKHFQSDDGAYKGFKLVEGGFEGDGTPIYIAHGQVDGSVTPGKIRNGWSSALVPKAGDEKKVHPYSVLCYA